MKDKKTTQYTKREENELLPDVVTDLNIKKGSTDKNEILTDLKQCLKELKMIEQGKLKSTPLQEFLISL